MRGLFITFEGMDGAGKSTQIRFVTEYLRELGLDVVNTREPGGCPISEDIREVVLAPENSDMDGRCEALLYAAARAQHVAQVIRPAIDGGKIVICDRFLDSSLAYQGYGRGLGVGDVAGINDFALNGLTIDRTFFLYIDPDGCVDRMHRRTTHDRIEREDMSFHKRVFDGFLELARTTGRIELIDVSGTKYETRDIIRGRMDALLRERGIL